jgi:hypothetical protein
MTSHLSESEEGAGDTKRSNKDDRLNTTVFRRTTHCGRIISDGEIECG